MTGIPGTRRGLVAERRPPGPGDETGVPVGVQGGEHDLPVQPPALQKRIRVAEPLQRHRLGHAQGQLALGGAIGQLGGGISVGLDRHGPGSDSPRGGGHRPGDRGDRRHERAAVADAPQGARPEPNLGAHRDRRSVPLRVLINDTVGGVE